MTLLTHQPNPSVHKNPKIHSKQAFELDFPNNYELTWLYIPALVKALRELGFSCCGQINFYFGQQACVNLLKFYKLSDFWLHNDSNFRSLTESDDFFTQL